MCTDRQVNVSNIRLLCRDVYRFDCSVLTALAEASDITVHLQSLRSLIESMEQGSIPELQASLTAFMRVVELIWQHSRYYRSAPRIIILLQEINNMLIDHVSFYVFLRLCTYLLLAIGNTVSNLTGSGIKLQALRSVSGATRQTGWSRWWLIWDNCETHFPNKMAQLFIWLSKATRSFIGCFYSFLLQNAHGIWFTA